MHGASYLTKALVILPAIVGVALATPTAAAELRTRVVGCEAGNCLLVTGRRADPAAAVSINGHAVAVEGSRKWRVLVPVETLRQWSAPLARTIMVSVADRGFSSETETRLPIGLLGQAEDLALLIVSVK